MRRVNCLALWNSGTGHTAGKVAWACPCWLTHLCLTEQSSCFQTFLSAPKMPGSLAWRYEQTPRRVLQPPNLFCGTQVLDYRYTFSAPIQGTVGGSIAM